MKITELNLLTDDLSAQRRFYMEVLRLPGAMSGHTLSLQAGSSKLSFKRTTDGSSGIYHFAFNIPENRFEEAKAWTSRRVPLIKSATGEDSFYFETWNAHSVYFRDPANNILEFIARHNLMNGSERPFDEQSILCISEIGIAADDVKGTVQLLGTGLNAGVYDGAGSDTFTAVGDEDGLFIVVKRGRIWFPDTGTMAELFPLEVITLANDGERGSLSGQP